MGAVDTQGLRLGLQEEAGVRTQSDLLAAKEIILSSLASSLYRAGGGPVVIRYTGGEEEALLGA